MIKVSCFVVGLIYTNCYLIEDEATGALAVIDPGCDSQALFDEIGRRGGRLEMILLTHGHFDHILGVPELIRRYHPTVCAGEKELELIADGSKNLTVPHRIRFEGFSVDRALSDGEAIELGESRITFIHTPGHTSGSGCYIVDDSLFSGDTLFCESCGRTDFPTSSPTAMRRSLVRLSNLHGDYTVYPGHEEFTTLAHERKFNPYM